MSERADLPDSDETEPLVRPEDIRSTSRSCLVVLLTGLLILLMLCIFVVVQTWIR